MNGFSLIYIICFGCCISKFSFLFELKIIALWILDLFRSVDNLDYKKFFENLIYQGLSKNSSLYIWIYLIIYYCQSLYRIIEIILYLYYIYCNNAIVENFIVKFSYIFLTKSSNYSINFNESLDLQIMFFRRMKSVSYKKLYNVMPRH